MTGEEKLTANREYGNHPSQSAAKMKASSEYGMTPEQIEARTRRQTIDRVTRERDAAARVAARYLLAGYPASALGYARDFEKAEKELERLGKENG